MSKSHQNEVEIAASADEVWRALTTGDGLARWFATHAEVEPGSGGRWLVSWDDSPPAEYGTIGVWQPARRLSLLHEGERDGVAAQMVEEFELVALDGGARTLLRVVASGFSSDGAWDEEFEGTKNGWAVFIRNLRHAVERHRDEPCHTLGLPFPGRSFDRADAFARVFGDGGVLAVRGELVEGGRVVVDTPWGGPCDAVVDFARAPALLGLVVEGLGLVRGEFVGSDNLFVHVMILAYGEQGKARVEAAREPLTAALTAAL